MKKMFLLAAVLSAATFLSACGDGGGSSETVAAADARVAVNPTTGPATVAALTNEEFAFAAGVPALGTNAATTLRFNPPAAAGGPARFTIASGGNTAIGTVGFGSCVFTVTASTFPDAHALGAGKTVTVDPCSIELDTNGMPADNQPRTTTVVITLGTTSSSGTTVTVTITVTGTVGVNGVTVTTVTLTEVTGT